MAKAPSKKYIVLTISPGDKNKWPPEPLAVQVVTAAELTTLKFGALTMVAEADAVLPTGAEMPPQYFYRLSDQVTKDLVRALAQYRKGR